MNKRQISHRRRVLLLANFAYTSAKAVATGVVRFGSPRPDIDLRIVGGHPENADAEYAASKRIRLPLASAYSTKSVSVSRVSTVPVGLLGLQR